MKEQRVVSNEALTEKPLSFPEYGGRGIEGDKDLVDRCF
jgi:hypothetical protein